MNLNIGSGAVTSPLAGWTTVDAMAWPVSIRADARFLPFKDRAFEQIHMAHVIEHIDIEEVPLVLSEIRRILRPTGIFYVAGPDSKRAKEAGSTYWAKVSHWGGATAGWDHRWDCSIPKLTKLLRSAGFVPRWTTGVPQGWPPNTHQWPLDFEARFLCRRDDCPWPTYYPNGYATIV